MLKLSIFIALALDATCENDVLVYTSIMAHGQISGGFTLCWILHKVADLPTNSALWLAVHVCIYSKCHSVRGTCHVPVSVTELCTSHCVQGAIGWPGRVIKVKLFPPRLFLPLWRDNRRASPYPLLFHTHTAFLPALLFDNSSPVSVALFALVRMACWQRRELWNVIKYV